MKPLACRARGLLVTALLSITLSGCGEDPRGLVEAMGRAYRSATTYSDEGRVMVRATRGDVAEDMTYPFRVAFARPDRIRIEAYDARIVTDGTALFGAVGAVPGQVLHEPVTSPLAMDQIFADDVLRSTLTEGEAGCPTQLPLLLADDTIDLILADAQSPPRLTGSEIIDGQSCSRVAIQKPDGVLELWIDRASHLLRRMKVPTESYADEVSRQAGVPVGVSVVVEFANASFDAAIPAEAFAFEVPGEAAKVSRLEPLQPPQPVHPLVGKQAELPPLTTADGATISRESLRGAAAVLEFFFEGCGPSSDSMPQVANGIAEYVSAHARTHTGERPTVRHFAISLDPDEVAVDTIRKRLAEFGGVGTLVRDPQGVTPQALAIDVFPAAIIVGADGVVADVITGRHGTIAVDVADALANAAAGLPAEKRLRERYERRLRDYRRELARAAGTGAEKRLPEQVIAPRRQPVRFKLERAWRAAGVTLPGNVTCLDEAQGADAVRIVCLDGWRTVVELDAAGAETGRHELGLPRDAGVALLRTAVDSAGRRWWLGLRRGGQHAYVFTDDWKLHASYPEQGSPPHEGISTAHLADLDGDGNPEIVAAFSGSDGLQVATLTGTRLWQDRSAAGVIDCAVGAPAEAGTPRAVLCIAANGRLMRAAKDGGRPAEGDLGEGVRFRSVVSGPVAMDHTWALLGTADTTIDANTAVGIDPVTLEPTWQLSLAAGVHRDGPIEPVAWADVLGTRRRQWLIAAPDGSVTVAWADGRIVDRYQHGQPLVGIGGYRDGGSGHVVLATKGGLEAFKVVDVALD